MSEELLFCPLGGSGEIGMNMNLFDYGNIDDVGHWEQYSFWTSWIVSKVDLKFHNEDFQNDLDSK